MPAASTDRVHLSVAEARKLSESAMRGIGYEPEEARILADHVLDAAVCGYEYSGLPKLLNVADHPFFKAPRHPMRVVKETSVSVLFDGGNQSGMLGMYYATRAVIERAQAHGFALVAVNNIWMSGRSAYYVEMAARAGLIAIHTVAAPPMVAPLGGAQVALGTIRSRSAFRWRAIRCVIDLGTSAFMGTDPVPPASRNPAAGGRGDRRARPFHHGRGGRPTRRHPAVRRAQGLRAGPRDARARRPL
jgi:LDH2 family malate/lactate/ureidoglycolate dehydrogenase